MSESTAITKDLLQQGKALLSTGQLEAAYECFHVIDQIDSMIAENISYLIALHDQPYADQAYTHVDLMNRLQALCHESECLALIESAFQNIEQKTSTEPIITQYPPLEIVTHRAAFIQLEITPQQLPIALQGYWTPHPRKTQKILDPLMMHLLMLEDLQGNRCLIVGADLFAFDPAIVKFVRQHAKHWNIEASAVFLNASHTHYAPCTLQHVHPGLGQWNGQYTKYIAEKIVSTLPLLRQQLQAAHVEYQACQAQIGLNRRVIDTHHKVHMHPNPQGLRFDHTPLLRITLQNQQRCLVVNHGCHPTGFGGASIMSADYIGSMRTALLQSNMADYILFLQGPAGNIKQAVMENHQGRWIQAHEVSLSGESLAQQMIQQSHQPWVSVLGEIESCSQEVFLKMQQKCSAESRQSVLYPAWKQYQKTQKPSSTASFELSSLKIGSIYLVAFEGEPTSEWGAIVQGIYGNQTFVLGYTNGIKAYLPTKKIVQEGGYEGDSSHLVYLLPAPFTEACEDLITQALKTQQSVLSTTNLNTNPASSAPVGTHVYTDVTDECKAFFVLSTGRSGTQTLAHLLEDATNAKVWHHPEPNLIHETKLSYWDSIDNHSIFWQGRGAIIAQAWDQGLIHGETDHNMTPFSHSIAQDIPHSKFLVLIRDPREFVRSGMRRGYYVAGGPWDEGRLRPHPQSADQKLWRGLKPFEKVCWLWAETYRHIERRINQIGTDRVKIVRFHDLIRSTQTSREIFEFLELDGYQEDHAKKTLSYKLNAQRGGQFPHPSEWSQQMHDIAWTYCGDIASQYGYDRIYEKK